MFNWLSIDLIKNLFLYHFEYENYMTRFFVIFSVDPMLQKYKIKNSHEWRAQIWQQQFSVYI